MILGFNKAARRKRYKEIAVGQKARLTRIVKRWGFWFVTLNLLRIHNNVVYTRAKPRTDIRPSGRNRANQIEPTQCSIK